MGGTGKLSLIGRRLLQAVPSLIGIVIVTFVLTRALPGDPAAYFAGPAADEQSIAEIRTALGLDRSLPAQFWAYVVDLSQGDLERLPASLELTLMGLLLAIAIALPLGILAATRPNSWIDHLCRVVVTAGVSLPVFFTGLFFVYIFYFVVDVVPSPIGRLDIFSLAPPRVTGFYLIDSLLVGDFETFRSALAQLALPAITMAMFVLAPLARMTRGSMLQVLGSEFIRTANANGLERRTILYTYAFRNALLPILTTLGMVFSFMLGANVLVEKVFAWPGIGSFAVNALVVSDFPAVQGFVLSMAILFVMLNLAIDVLYTLIDPRVGIEG